MTTDKKAQILHRYTEKLVKLGICVSVFFLLTICVSSVIRAQTTSQIFTTIPPRLEIQVKPGEFVKKTIQFRNEGEETVYLAVLPKDFIVKQVNGTPEFVSETVSGRWSAASWIRVNPKSLVVAPKLTTNVELLINVPLDARPGGHYAGILYQSTGTPFRVGGTGVGAGPAVQQVVGTLVYITVAGPVTEKAQIIRFEAPKFLEYGPVPFTTEIANQSDLHITPRGQITIRDSFGKTAAILKLDERNIFPGASLIYQNTWAEKYPIGRYRADLALAYGSQGQALAATIFFWVFPWKVVMIALLAIILIILLVVLIYGRIRRRQEELEEKLLEEKDEIEELKEELHKKEK